VGSYGENWDWRDRGVVLFLAAISYSCNHWQTSGYRTVVYEWSARWQRWIDRFGVMNPEMISRVPQKYAHKFAVVGDLMVEAGGEQQGNREQGSRETAELIGILPGSKPANWLKVYR